MFPYTMIKVNHAVAVAVKFSLFTVNLPRYYNQVNHAVAVAVIVTFYRQVPPLL